MSRRELIYIQNRSYIIVYRKLFYSFIFASNVQYMYHKMKIHKRQTSTFNQTTISSRGTNDNLILRSNTQKIKGESMTEIAILITSVTAIQNTANIFLYRAKWNLFFIFLSLHVVHRRSWLIWLVRGHNILRIEVSLKLSAALKIKIKNRSPSHL